MGVHPRYRRRRTRGRAPGPAYDGAVRHYLDHAATTPLRPAAREAWLDASARVGNPSSLHTSGRAARGIVEDARERIGAALGADAAEVILTSGGTEADNLAVKGLWWGRRAGADRVLVSAVEHHAVLDPARWLADAEGAALVELPVDRAAVVDVAAVEAALAAGPAALVAVQWVNNETGAVQPVERVAVLAAESGVPFHCDAVQAVGHLAVDFHALGATTMAISAHKLGGPVGVGALLARRDAPLAALTHGGGQERKVRSGTVDAPGAAAFAAAVEEAVARREGESTRLAALRDSLRAGIAGAVPDARLTEPPDDAPHIIHAVFPGSSSEAMLTALDLAGIEVSSGSACTAGVVEASHVVEAMGGSRADAGSALRFSLGEGSTEADVEAAVRALPAAVAMARSTRRS